MALPGANLAQEIATTVVKEAAQKRIEGAVTKKDGHPSWYYTLQKIISRRPR